MTLRKVCPQCQTIVDDDAVFCYKCGADLKAVALKEVKQCPSCGAVLGDEDVFCTACGTMINNAAKTATSLNTEQTMDMPPLVMTPPEVAAPQQPAIYQPSATVQPSSAATAQEQLQKLEKYMPEVKGTDITNYIFLAITFFVKALSQQMVDF